MLSFHAKFTFIGLVASCLLIYSSPVLPITLEAEIKEAKVLIEKLARVAPGTPAAEKVAMEIMHSYQCKKMLKSKEYEKLGATFHDLIYGPDGDSGIAKKILDKAKANLGKKYASLAPELESIRNKSSTAAKKPPMDLDFGVLADNNDDLKRILAEIEKKGGNIADFHSVLEEEFGKAFREVGTDLGLPSSALNPDKALIAGTTGFHPEAYKDVGAIKGDTPLGKWAAQSSDVSRYKIDELQELVEEGLFSAESAAQEAARGTVKDLEKLDKTFNSISKRTGKTPKLSKVNKKLRTYLKELSEAKDPRQIQTILDQIDDLTGNKGVFNACNDLMDNMEAAWKLLATKSDPERLLKLLFKDLLSADDYIKATKALEDGNFDDLPGNIQSLRKKLFNLAAGKRTSLSNPTVDALLKKLEGSLMLKDITGDTRQVLIDLLEQLDSSGDPKLFNMVFGESLGDSFAQIKRLMSNKVKSSLIGRLASKVPLRTLDGKLTSLELGDTSSTLGADAFIGIAMAYVEINSVMDKQLPPDQERRELQKAVVTNMPIVGDIVLGINSLVEAGYEGSWSKAAQSATYFVIGVAGFVPGFQLPALVAGLGMGGIQLGGLAWDAYWDRELVNAWIASGVWDDEGSGKLLRLKDNAKIELEINFASLADKFNNPYFSNYYKMTVRDSVFFYAEHRKLAGNKEIEAFRTALISLYPEMRLDEALRQPGNRGEGLVRAAIKLAGDTENIDRNLALAIYGKYKIAYNDAVKEAIKFLHSQAEKEYQARHHVGEALQTFQELDALGKRLGLSLVERVNTQFNGFSSFVKESFKSPLLIDSLARRKVQLAERYLAGYLEIEAHLAGIAKIFQIAGIKMPDHNMTGYLEIDGPRISDLEMAYQNGALIPARKEVERAQRELSGDESYQFRLQDAGHCELTLFRTLAGILVRRVEAVDRRLLLQQWTGKRSAAEASRDEALQELQTVMQDENVEISVNPLNFVATAWRGKEVKEGLGQDVTVLSPTLRIWNYLGDSFEAAYAWTNVRWEGSQVYEDAIETQDQRIKQLDEEFTKASNTTVLDLRFCLDKLPKLVVTFSVRHPAPGDHLFAEAKIVSGELPKGAIWQWQSKGEIDLRDNRDMVAGLTAHGNGTVSVQLVSGGIIIARASAELTIQSGVADEPEEEPGQPDDGRDDGNAQDGDDGDVTDEGKGEDEEGDSQGGDKTGKDSDTTTNPGTKRVPGTGGASGVYPPYEFNGMQLSYQISGGSLAKMKDEPGWTTSRRYEGRLGAGELVVSGTARRSWSSGSEVRLKVSAGNEQAEKSIDIPEGKGVRLIPFRLAIKIPENATSGSFLIDMLYSGRSVEVSGYLSADGPTGKAPKGTIPLDVKIKAPEGTVSLGQDMRIQAEVSGGRFPYQYSWSGPVVGTGVTAKLVPVRPGSQVVTLSVQDIDGDTATVSINVQVAAGDFEVVGLPSRPVYGSSANLSVVAKGGGKGAWKPLWQASEPGIEFDPPDGMNTRITFGRMGSVKIWAQVLDPKDEGSVGEAKQVAVEVIGPKFILKLNPTKPRVGEEIRASISSSPGIPEELVSYKWSTPESSNRMEYNDPASEIGFSLRDTKSLNLKAEAVTPFYGDVIGIIQGNIKAALYTVKIAARKYGPPKLTWDPEKKGLVEVGQNVYLTGEEIRLSASLEGTPKPRTVNWKWRVEDGVTISNSNSQTPMVSRSSTGNIKARAVATNQDKVFLGTASITLSVSEPVPAPTGTGSESNKKAQVEKLSKEAQKQVDLGKMVAAEYVVKQIRKLDRKAAASVAQMVAATAKKSGWRAVYDRDFPRAIQDLKIAGRLNPKDGDTAEKSRKAERFAGIWPRVETKAREFDQLLAGRKVWSAQKAMLQMQDLQFEMPGQMANPLSQRVMDDFNNALKEYNVFITEKNSLHSQYFLEKNWQAMLENARQSQTRELSVADAREAKSRIDFANRMLTEDKKNSDEVDPGSGSGTGSGAATGTTQPTGEEAYRIENWYLNANGYLGVLQLRKQNGQTTARIHFSGYTVPVFDHAWEPVTELQLAGNSIRFERPNAAQSFEGQINGSTVAGTFAGGYTWTGELKETRSILTRNTAEVLGTWAINASGYTGKLEISGRSGALTGRVFFNAHAVWEDLTEISFNEALAELRFLRPGAGQHYVGTLEDQGLSGTFDKVNPWQAERVTTVKTPMSEAGIVLPTTSTAGTSLPTRGPTNSGGYPNIAGNWIAYTNGNKVADCSIEQDGSTLTFIIHRTPQVKSSGRLLDANTLVADDWGPQQGTIRQDKQRIDWKDSWWERQRSGTGSSGGDLGGKQLGGDGQGEVSNGPKVDQHSDAFHFKETTIKVSDSSNQPASYGCGTAEITGDSSVETRWSQTDPYTKAVISYVSKHSWTHPPATLIPGEEIATKQLVTVTIGKAGYDYSVGASTTLRVDTDMGGPLFSGLGASAYGSFLNFPLNGKTVEKTARWTVPTAKMLYLTYQAGSSGICPSAHITHVYQFKQGLN